MVELLTALAIVFVTGGALLLVAHHLSLSPIPFYIGAGLIAGTVVSEQALLDLAQWGIAFLVFVFGFRTDLSSIQAVFRDSEVAAMTQVVVIGPIAFAIATGFGFDPRNALYFAIAATLSSSIVGLGTFQEEIRATLVYGRLGSSIHFFDDMLAVGLILVLSPAVLTVDSVTSQIGFGVIFVIVALLFYRHGFAWLVRVADGSDELILMGTISILIGFIGGAELAGVSIVVGAFAAGLAIRTDSTESIKIINGMLSIRDFFVAIFFITVGALVSVPSAGVLVVASTLILLVVLVNPAVTILAFLYEGYDTRTAFLASTSINQVSELTLVIAIQGLFLGTISAVIFEAIILAAGATMILNSLTREWSETLYQAFIAVVPTGPHHRMIDERSHVRDDLSDHVIIAGYGRQGRSLAHECEQAETPYVIIENDPVMWDDIENECENYVLADALESYSWALAGIDEASLVISTIDHRPVSEFILEIETKADIILRSRDPAIAREWMDSGAAFVAVPDLLASERLVENVTAVLGERTPVQSLKTEHLAEFTQLDRLGFGSRYFH